MLDSNGLMLLIPVMVGLFILMARIDLYLAKRRNQMANARYMAEMDSSRQGVGVRV